MYNRIKEYTTSQDFQQHLYMGINVTIELYRVLVSTLLILFIPQDCGGGQMCSLLENMASSDNIYTTGISFNFITFGVFLILYAIEISREKKLIKYLEVNPQIPSDNESLTLIFDIIPVEYKNKIYRLDFYYQKTTYACVLLFIVNTIISSMVIYHYSLGNQTTTTFITNVLFMATKVYDSYSIANTEESIFYSAYMRNHVQFNDIDPSFKRRLSTIMMKREYQEIEIDVREDEVEDEDEVEEVLSEIVTKIADTDENTNIKNTNTEKE